MSSLAKTLYCKQLIAFINQSIQIISHLFQDFSMILVLSLVECNDFCQEFERNGNKIDYGYQHNEGPHENKSMSWLLIIGHKYWKIDYSDGFHTNGSLVLETQSQTSEGFGREYKFAVCDPVQYNSTIKYQTGLFRVI